jgi:hypothetical protein
VQVDLLVATTANAADAASSLLLSYGASSAALKEKGRALARTPSTRYLRGVGRKILLKATHLIRRNGRRRFTTRLFDDLDPATSRERDGGRERERGRDDLCVHPFSHVTYSATRLSPRILAALGFCDSSRFLARAAEVLRHERDSLAAFLSRVLSALFTAVNMDTSIIHEMVSATERAISCHLEKEKGRGKERGRGRGKERGRGKGVVWVRLRVALPFGDSEAVEVLRTTTAAPDTHSELCLDLLLSTLCADVAAHLLDEEEREEEEEEREEPLLVDGDSLFARTVCAALLLSFIAFVRDSSLEVEGEEEQQQEEEGEGEGDG